MAPNPTDLQFAIAILKGLLHDVPIGVRPELGSQSAYL